MEEHDRGALLYRAPSAEQATLLAEVLVASGVPARCVGGSLQNAFGDLGADALLVEVWVPARALEAGRAVVERFYAEREASGERPA